MAESAAKLVSNTGKRLLASRTCPNKDSLVKSLKQAASALSELDQSPSLASAIKPLSESLIKHNLITHKDKDVKLLVASCFTEIIRDIFKLFLRMFAELADTSSPYFSRRVKILETVAKLQCFLILLDIGCDDIIIEMFNTFFLVVREHHQQSLVNGMVSIMTLILREKASPMLLDVLLQNLLKEGKGAPLASAQLAASVMQNCRENLEPLVHKFLRSCILDPDCVRSELKEFYHEIIYEIFQFSPQMLLAVIPNLTQELLTDQVDTRIKAVNLIGKLFALPEHHVAAEYRNLFLEFLKRFADKSVEVRISVLQCTAACYMANPSSEESHELLTALESRLLDFDDKVRMQAVIVVCDLMRSNPKFVPPELLSRASERLRDKKISVRKKGMQKLLEVYRHYCMKCSEGFMTLNDQFEQIPCKILMLCYDKDCKDFRPQNMELLLSESLFPDSLPAAERAKHWIHLFSLFTPLHAKALNSILSQKRRLRTEMQVYLSLRRKAKEIAVEEVEKRIKASILKISACFPDPCKAEELLNKLNQIKDNGIFNALVQLLDEETTKNGLIYRDKFLKLIGNKHPHFEFMQLLSTKCVLNIFSCDHIPCILDLYSSYRFENEHLAVSSIRLLMAIISNFPSLLRGCEKQFLNLLEVNNPINEMLIQTLAKAIPHTSVQSSDIQPFLERVCLEGTRNEAKFAVSALAALASNFELSIFPQLCKKLVEALHKGANIPTLLQSLGCIAQHSLSSFESHERVIRQYIIQNIFEGDPSVDEDLFDEVAGCSFSCKLKIYALKVLVKSFTHYQGSRVRCEISGLLDILSNLLQGNDIFNGGISSDSDKAHIRLASAKLVLRLSRRWDLHISPKLFHLTVSVAKDSSYSVCRSYLDKLHKFLKERAISSRYACAFALVSADLQEDALKYMTEFIKECSREARANQDQALVEESMTDYPVYILVFLIHVLAHDSGFPPENCQEADVYVQFCRPLAFVLRALLHDGFDYEYTKLVKTSGAYVHSIFQAIKRSEDAVVPRRTQDNLNHTAQVSMDEHILKQMTHVIASHLLQSQPFSLGGKHGQKCQDAVDLLTDGPKEGSQSTHMERVKSHEAAMQGITSRGRQKRALSPIPPVQSDVHSDKDHQAKRPSRNSQPVSRSEQISSCDSGSIRPSLAKSQVSTCKLNLRVSAQTERAGRRGKNSNKISKSISGRVKDCCLSKDSVDTRDVRIGQRIKLWSPMEKCFYLATVQQFHSQSNSHEILYDNGEAELLCLAGETWDTLSDDSIPEKVAGASGNNAPKEQENLLCQERGNLMKSNLSLPATGKRDLKVSLDTSKSEVVNTNENAIAHRTRRSRKA
ncbi:hypothetical protein RJ641_029400 [Dillenia turbinata]|uniref:Sister chromatid cohesion protein n=1 Tax=Dillenia turbinata TaxID=194707 RepID=A0AAN8ZG84_9MAGN